MSESKLSQNEVRDESIADVAKTPRLLRVIPAVVLALGLLLGALRGYLLINCIEPENGLYARGAETKGLIFFALMAVMVALCLLAYFPAKKHPSARPIKNEAVVTAFSSTVLAFMFAALFVYGVVMLVSGKAQTNIVFLILETALSLPAAFYFWHVCVSGARQKETDPLSPSVLPLFPAIFAGVRTVERFIDTTKQINASERSFALLTLVLIMAFFIAEAWFYAPKRSSEKNDAVAAQKAAKYYVLCLLVVLLAASVVIPYALASAFWLYSAADILYYLLAVCVGLYALLRVFIY